MAKTKLTSEIIRTKVLPCSCSHPWQDVKYGRGMRVFNACTKNPDMMRCVVCGSIRPKTAKAAFVSKAVERKTSTGAKKLGLKASGKQGRKKKPR